MTSYKGAAARARGGPPRGGRHQQQTPKPTVAPAPSGSKMLAAGLIGTAALAGAYALTSHIEAVQQGGPDALSAPQIVGPDSQTATLAASFGELPGVSGSTTSQPTATPSTGTDPTAGVLPQGTSDRLPTPAGRPTTNAFGFGGSGGVTFPFSTDGITGVMPFAGLNVSPPTEIGNTSRPNSGGNFTLQVPFGNQTPSSGQSFQPAPLNGVGSDPFYTGLAAALNPANVTQTALNSFSKDLANLNSLDSPFALVPTTGAPGVVTTGPAQYAPLQFPPMADPLIPAPVLDPGPVTFDQRFNAASPNGLGMGTGNPFDLVPTAGAPGVETVGQPQYPPSLFPTMADPLSHAPLIDPGPATFDQRFNATSPNGLGLDPTSPSVGPQVPGQGGQLINGQPGPMFTALDPANATSPVGSGDGGPSAASPTRGLSSQAAATPAPDPTAAPSTQAAATPAPDPTAAPSTQAATTPAPDPTAAPSTQAATTPAPDQTAATDPPPAVFTAPPAPDQGTKV
jgi:hypothetical protein